MKHQVPKSSGPTVFSGCRYSKTSSVVNARVLGPKSLGMLPCQADIWRLFGKVMFHILAKTIDSVEGGCVFTYTYCWWTTSCTTKDDDYPIIYRVLTIPGGAGFCPSTVHHILYISQAKYCMRVYQNLVMSLVTTTSGLAYQNSIFSSPKTGSWLFTIGSCHIPSLKLKICPWK